MKKKLLLFAVLLAGTLSGCTKNHGDQPKPEPEPSADYTLMLYGCGGGNLDFSTGHYLVEKLMEAGSSEKVNYCFEYKLSKKYQERTTFTGARRWAAPQGGVPEDVWTDCGSSEIEPALYVIKFYDAIQRYSENVGGMDYDLSDPDHIAQYIDWCKANYPAKKYILLMKDHGGGWDFFEDSDEAKTKAQIYDDNLHPVLYQCER